MNMTVYTGTDTTEAGPSLDDATASVSNRWVGDDGAVHIALSSSIPNLDLPDGDSGLWTVILTMSVEEAHRLADGLVKGAVAAIRGDAIEEGPDGDENTRLRRHGS